MLDDVGSIFDAVSNMFQHHQHVEWSSNTVAKRENVGSLNMLDRPPFIVWPGLNARRRADEGPTLET